MSEPSELFEGDKATEPMEDKPTTDSNEVAERTAKKTKKEAKPKRVLTAEEKAIRIENLKRGRQTALENRRKKAMLKQIEKEEQEKAVESKLKNHLDKKHGDDEIKTQLYSLKDELKELKAMLKEATTNREKTQIKQEIKEKQEEARELKTEQSNNKTASLNTPVPKSEPATQPKPVPAPTLIPQVKKPIVYSTFKMANW